MKKTKIVATVGPASDKKEVLKELILSGVDVFRFNFSHGTHEYHQENLDKIKEVEAELGVRVGILQDICGPKVRVSKLKEDFELKDKDRLTIYKSEILGEKLADKEYKISINKPEILNLLRVGEYIYLCDGAIMTKVIEVSDDKIVTEVENHGILSSNKGVNFPNTEINIEILTEKDKIDLAWGAKNEVSFVAISFVQNKNDVLKARKILDDLGSKARVYSKIEKFDAVKNIDEIIEVSDGIMVARGDLGIEVPYYEVPLIQKIIIKKANELNKPVITATQMMFSMAKNERATRAEISDVANAVLDGTDAVMLSEESAVGINPAGVVKAMRNTIIETEKIYPYNKFDEFKFFDETDMVASNAARLASEIKANAILAITASGKSAIKISRNRTNIDIIAAAHDELTLRSLNMVWGVTPRYLLEKDRIDVLLSQMIKSAYESKKIDMNGVYILTAGHPIGAEGSTNVIRILKKDQIKYYLES